MLASSSFVATNCPDIIFATSLAVTGGRADDSTMATPGWVALTVPLVPAVDVAVTNAGRVANDCTMLAACLPIWLIVAMLAMADAGGRVPRGTAAGDKQNRDTCLWGREGGLQVLTRC